MNMILIMRVMQYRVIKNPIHFCYGTNITGYRMIYIIVFSTLDLEQIGGLE